MKIILFLLLFSTIPLLGNAQQAQIYKPEADVSKAIAQGLAKAKSQHKHLLLQIGGNWCPWCVKFHTYCSEEREIKTVLDANYIYLLVNYSKENRNLPELKKLDYPQRFGFPVFVILDENGKRIHTQNSAYLEEGEGYSKKKIIDFLKAWTTDALKPEHYKEK
jgi:thioredoxin-related protein